MNKRLPVTLVGGFLGAGKTSFLHHAISEYHGGYLAVLVENPGVLNLDAKAIRGLCGAMRRSNDTVLEIPDGDEAAQTEWIAAQLRDLSATARHERVLIEVGGMTNPLRLARHFGLIPGQPNTFSAWAELQQIICVVDVLDFSLSRTKPASVPSFWEFQNEQIAGATQVILNKCDLIDDKERDLCTETLRKWYPGVHIIQTAYGEMPPEVWQKSASPQDLELSFERHPPQEIANTPEPEVASALYRVYRPFHPQRFWDWFNSDHSGLLRVKGIVWLATRNLLVGGVSRTIWQNGCGVAGIWWAALPREEWPEEPEALARMQETWREPYGDRRQELILIGDAAQISTTMRRQLDACLLSDEEFARPPKEWATFPDPFPEWDVESGEDT
jgi:G3E family GTPase